MHSQESIGMNILTQPYQADVQVTYGVPGPVTGMDV